MNSNFRPSELLAAFGGKLTSALLRDDKLIVSNSFFYWSSFAGRSLANIRAAICHKTLAVMSWHIEHTAGPAFMLPSTPTGSENGRQQLVSQNVWWPTENRVFIHNDALVYVVPKFTSQ